MSYLFRRTQRLLKAEDFTLVFEHRRSLGNAYFQIYIRPNPLGHARLGLIVSKKVAKRANRRNYIKRTLREWFRLCQYDIKPFDVIIRAKQKYSCENSTEAMQALQELFGRLNIWQKHSCL